MEVDGMLRSPTLKPVLIPKLRIHFADFPYLHCSIDIQQSLEFHLASRPITSRSR